MILWRLSYVLTHARPLPRRTARREKEDPRAGALVRARFLPRHLRDVRLRADEPDRCIRWISAAVSALAVRIGIRRPAQASPLRPRSHLRDGDQQRPVLRLFAGIESARRSEAR